MRQLRWWDVRLAIITSALVLAGYIGIVEGYNALHISTTLIRRATTAAQLGYGVLALVALGAILRRHRVAGPLLEFWGSMFTATTIVVPSVRGDGPVSSGLRAGVITALVVAALIWLWRANQRLPSNHPSRRAVQRTTVESLHRSS
jgi:peptidoglycan/LPS O-acetylase OafA/YrhL